MSINYTTFAQPRAAREIVSFTQDTLLPTLVQRAVEQHAHLLPEFAGLRPGEDLIAPAEEAATKLRKLRQTAISDGAYHRAGRAADAVARIRSAAVLLGSAWLFSTGVGVDDIVATAVQDRANGWSSDRSDDLVGMRGSRAAANGSSPDRARFNAILAARAVLDSGRDEKAAAEAAGAVMALDELNAALGGAPGDVAGKIDARWLELVAA